MKTINLLLGAGLAVLLAGCAATPPVALAPVGPESPGRINPGSDGSLEVYSSLSVQSDDQNQASRDPTWEQHTDYYLYDRHQNLVRRVDNTIGHYEEAPRLVTLAAGQYYVKAQANDYNSWVMAGDHRTGPDDAPAPGRSVAGSGVCVEAGTGLPARRHSGGLARGCRHSCRGELAEIASRLGGRPGAPRSRVRLPRFKAGEG